MSFCHFSRSFPMNLVAVKATWDLLSSEWVLYSSIPEQISNWKRALFHFNLWTKLSCLFMTLSHLNKYKEETLKHLMMELNYFIDSWNRITIHQIVHLLNNITVCQRICKYTCVLNDSAVNKIKVTPFCYSSDNIQAL